VRIARQLAHLPDSGKVLLASPDDKGRAIVTASTLAVDYLLTGYIPEGRMFVMNVDAATEARWIGADQA
jgi:hypothetical protein